MDTDKKNWFRNIDTIIKEPLKFKAKLDIGEDAYKSLKVKNAASELWDVTGIAAAGATVAKSTIVASTFFAPTGILASLGIGAAAVTPIGWVVGIGIVTGGAGFGIIRFFKNSARNRVTVIPNFINTPMDILALSLFDLLAPLALKVAVVDGNVDETERSLIRSYFVKDWGYDEVFIKEGLKFTEENLSNFSIKELALILAEFTKKNPDCNHKAIAKELTGFIRDIIEADGIVDEREEMALEKVQNIFKEIDQWSIKKMFNLCSISAKKGNKKGKST